MKDNLTLLTTPKTVRRGQVVEVAIGEETIPFQVIWITNKTISLKSKVNREKKIAFWSDRKGRYSIDGRYMIV